MAAKAFQGPVSSWIAAHDHFSGYRTTREAWYTRGSVIGSLAAYAVLSLGLVTDTVLRPMLSGSFLPGPYLLALLIGLLEVFVPAVFLGLLVGGVFGIRVPKGFPFAERSLVTGLLAGSLDEECQDAVERAWLREDAWLPLDAALSFERLPWDGIRIPEGLGAVGTVIAAETLANLSGTAALTDWQGPGDPGNRVMFLTNRDATQIPRHQGTDAFRQHFSAEALAERWDVLPPAVRERAEPEKEGLLARAAGFAAGRLAVLDGLGTAADGIGFLAAHTLGLDGPDLYRFLALHEAGHVRLAAYCGDRGTYLSVSRDWGSGIGRAMAEVQPVPLSLYALMTPSEFFAEHYAAWRHGAAAVTPGMAGLMKEVCGGRLAAGPWGAARTA